MTSKNIDTPEPVEPLVFTIGKNLTLEPLECTQPWECAFNVTGVENVLGRSIMVHILGYNAPEWGAICTAESNSGEKATQYLWELLDGAKNVTLLRPYKVEGNPALKGRILIDGVDIARRMIDLGAAYPWAVRVDWCKPPREIEV
jgi:hypothetical protein